MTQQSATSNQTLVYGQASLPNLYVDGLQLSNVLNEETKYKILSGQCRDSLNAMDIILSDDTTIDFGVNGVNGLDTGEMTASTIYAVYAIADITNYKPVATIASLSATTPYLPFGYSNFRRIGWLITSSGNTIFQMYTTGTGKEKAYFYKESTISKIVLNAGSATTWTAVSLAAYVPPISTQVTFSYTLVTGTVTDIAQLRVTGDGQTEGVVIKNCAATASAIGLVVVPTVDEEEASIDYIVTSSGDDLSLSVYSFVDYL